MAGLVAAGLLAASILTSTITALAENMVGGGDAAASPAPGDPGTGGPGPGDGAPPGAGVPGDGDPGEGADGPGGDGADDEGAGEPEPPPVPDYLADAFEAAGIDPADWDPAGGVDENGDIITAVYEYYGGLYLDDPNMQWAGMANMIGPSFAAGFYDLDLFEDIFSALGDASIAIPGVQGDISELAAHLTEAELRWFENRFLTMQQKIFLDQAPAHEAYRADGIDGINAMFDAGQIPADMHQAWSKIHEGIETGDQSLIDEGNRELLWREQSVIIEEDYQAMYNRDPIGPLMTYAMTLIGKPSVPGAQGFPDVFPIVIEQDIGVGPDNLGCVRWVGCVDNPLDGSVEITTPLPDGNIAFLDDRWALIEEDTLPAYLDLIKNDPDTAAAIVGSSVDDRIDDYRLDVTQVIRDLVDFDFDFDQ